MAQASSSTPSHPTLINLPAPGSHPDTPEMPGTPTSTTTSLSALSTTAIKDGHRGHLPQGQGALPGRGHQHNPSTTSLEAERADRISRLAGLERVSTLRAPPQQQGRGSSISPQTTPTSTTGFPVNFPANYPASQHLTPAYFDSNGQPVAVTKMSTVGTASATESHVGEGEESVASLGPDPDAMDEDLDAMGTRSIAGYDDRMSDDGSASLVGFGEGASSTVSGPIYHRRPIPGMTTAQQAFAAPPGPERTNSGLSDVRRERDFATGGEAPITTAVQERRDARMMDGVADAHHVVHPGNQDGFVDTTFRGPVPVGQAPGREAAERIVQRLDNGETRAGTTTLGSPGAGGERLGKFYFEGDKRDE